MNNKLEERIGRINTENDVKRNMRWKFSLNKKEMKNYMRSEKKWKMLTICQISHMEVVIPKDYWSKGTEQKLKSQKHSWKFF